MLKHVPVRMCVSCRERKEKAFLIKVVKAGDNFSLDLTAKAEGRGAYVCNQKGCIDKAVKKRSFDKSFRRKVPDEIYDELVKITDDD